MGVNDTMYNLDAMFEVARAHNATLRSIAKPHPFLLARETNAEPFRRRLGRAIIRFGRWLADHRPESPTRRELPST